MAKTPKVSVITVCRNVADALEKTLRNVARQDYTDMEVIVVDGASTDRTTDVLKEMGNVVDKSVSEPDRGIYDAMNKGVAMATGEYCIFMNAGDEFAATDTLSRVFSCNHDADIIYGDVVKTGRDGLPHVKPAEPAHNAHRMFFCHQSSLVRTECLRRQPFDTRYTMSADFKFFKQMWKEGRTFLRLDFPVALFDTGGVSNTRRADGIRQNVAIIKELDGPIDRLRLLPRLYFVLLMLRLKSGRKRTKP